MWLPDVGGMKGPKYLAIANAVAEAVESGKLSPGQKLPPHRELAYQLKVSVQTVFRAYAELERRRLAVGEVGRGTFIRYLDPDSVSSFIVDKGSENLIDMSTMAPVTSHLHTKAIAKVLRQIADDPDMMRLMTHRPIIGSSLHRASAARWLRGLGVRADSNGVIITNGAQHGLLVALTAFAEPGDSIACASLTDSAVVTMADSLNMRLVGLETDGEGILPGDLDAACRRGPIRVLCVTPNLNNPTTVTMSSGRRREIAEIARRHDIWIVEDDVFGPLLKKRHKPFQTLAPERTCYATSFSKSVMHSLRTGYLVAPPPVIDRLTSRLRTTGWMSNPFSAEIAMRWTADGTVERLIDWQRQELFRRNRAFGKMFSGCSYASNPVSHHIWFQLPGGVSPDRFVSKARERNLLVTGPSPFVAEHHTDPNAIRITIGDAVRSGTEFKQGLTTLRRILGEFT